MTRTLSDAEEEALDVVLAEVEATLCDPCIPEAMVNLREAYDRLMEADD